MAISGLTCSKIGQGLGVTNPTSKGMLVSWLEGWMDPESIHPPLSIICIGCLTIPLGRPKTTLRGLGSPEIPPLHPP